MCSISISTVAANGLIQNDRHSVDRRNILRGTIRNILDTCQIKLLKLGKSMQIAEAPSSPVIWEVKVDRIFQTNKVATCTLDPDLT